MSDEPTLPPDTETESASGAEAISTPQPEAMPLPKAEVKPQKPRAETIGDIVRRRRDLARMTLEELAERAQLTPNYVGSVERGRRDPSLSTVVALAKGLNVRPQDLFPPVELSPAVLEAAALFDGPFKRRRRLRLKGIVARLRALLRSILRRLRL